MVRAGHWLAQKPTGPFDSLTASPKCRKACLMAAILSGGQGFPLDALPVGLTPNDSFKRWCVVLQTSPGHLQAWIHISTLPLEYRSRLIHCSGTMLTTCRAPPDG